MSCRDLDFVCPIFSRMRAGAAAACFLAVAISASAAPADNAQILEILQLQARAQNGDTGAQVGLGDLFGNRGQFAEALVWYRRAATNGEVTAQLTLAACLIAGKGTTANRKEAAYWMRMAADRVEQTEKPVEGAVANSAMSNSSRAPALIITQSNSISGAPIVERTKNLFTNAVSRSTHELRSDNLAGIELKLQEPGTAIHAPPESK